MITHTHTCIHGADNEPAAAAVHYNEILYTRDAIMRRLIGYNYSDR